MVTEEYILIRNCRFVMNYVINLSSATLYYLQIKETFERIQRQTKEKEQEAATNPISNIAVELDASGLCYSNRDTYITELFNIPINSFSISQSVDVSFLVTLVATS